MCKRRILAAVLAGVYLLLASPLTPATQGFPKGILVLDGRSAPPLMLRNMDGETWDINDARGHWVFVHFWASWCGPCRREMPGIERMISALGDSELEIVLINTAETEDEVFIFLGIVAPELVPLMDSDGKVTEVWQPRGLPATYLVDPEGNIQYQALGGREWEKPVYLTFLRSLDQTKQ